MRRGKHETAPPERIGTGYGGKMTDGDVRNATQVLEKAIVALQRKLGWGPFPYRTEKVEED